MAETLTQDFPTWWQSSEVAAAAEGPCRKAVTEEAVTGGQCTDPQALVAMLRFWIYSNSTEATDVL